MQWYNVSVIGSAIYPDVSKDCLYHILVGDMVCLGSLQDVPVTYHLHGLYSPVKFCC